MEQLNKYGLKVGDIVEFVNQFNRPVKLTITDVGTKSCWVVKFVSRSRNSWNTINTYIDRYNATINNTPAIGGKMKE